MDATTGHDGEPWDTAVHGRELDFSPLTARGSLRARLRALSSDALLLMGMTLGVLLAVVPGLALLIVLTGEDPVDWGLVVLLLMLLGSGIYVMLQVLHRARTGSRLSEVARVNDLEATTSLGARHYAGELFRRGERIVRFSLRTRHAPILEVGDSWPMERIRVRFSATTHVASVRNAPEAKVFLRAVLSGAVREQWEGELLRTGWDHAGPSPSGPELLTPALRGALQEFTGGFTLEITGDELTVMGDRPLEPTRPERLRRGFALIGALAARAESLLVDPAAPLDPTAPLDPSAPRPGRPPSTGGGAAGGRQGRHPLVVVGAVLAMMIIIPLGIAVVMSSLEGLLRGNEGGAEVVVSLLLVVVTALVSAVMRWVTRRRRTGTAAPGMERPVRFRRLRRGLLLLGAVVLLLILAATSWSLLRPVPAFEDPDAGLASAAECAAQDTRCQWNVSQRLWAEEHGLTRYYGLVEASCKEDPADPERSRCSLHVECEDGHSDFVVVYEGDPWVVVGARTIYARPEDPLATTDEEIARVVAESCHS